MGIARTIDLSGTLSRNNAFALVNVAQTQLGKAEAQLNYSEQWYTDFVTDCAKLANQFKDLR